MYLPKATHMRLDQAHALIDAFGFATLVDESLQVSHLPLVLKRDEGDVGTLHGHFARANPHWRTLEGQRVMAIFTGPHAYVSPTWYASKPAVPTWNYVAVHASGSLRLLDGDDTLASLEMQLSRFEPTLLEDDTVLSDAYRDRLLPGIVGFSIRLHEIQGKAKLGLHRSPEDQAGVMAGLRDSGDPQALRLWRYLDGEYDR